MLVKLKIRTRLIIGFGGLICLFMAGSFLAFLKLDALHMKAKVVSAEASPLLDAIAETEQLLTLGHLKFEEILSGAKNDDFSSAYATWEQALWYCDAILHGRRNNDREYIPARDGQIRKQVSQARTEILSLVKVAKTRAQKSPAAGSSLVDQQFDAAYHQSLNRMKQAKGRILTLLKESDRKISSAYASGRLILLFSVLLTLICSIALSTAISRSIIHPVEALARATKRIANGELDLEPQLQVRSNDEIGQLIQSFNEMTVALEQNVGALHQEKQNVEQKVVEAVRQAEKERRTLEQHVRVFLREIEKFADGDLEVKLPAVDDPLIHELNSGFNRAVANMKTAIDRVSETVAATVNASAEIARMTKYFSEGAQLQTAQSFEIVGAVEQMTATIVENTKNITVAASAAKSSGQSAKEGGEKVVETIQAMNTIAEVAQELAQTISELGAGSDQIGNIIRVIDEIADQTNLLALNAAIEAARAGEQGRGFAVVADEVRKLAERTTRATKEIAAMISTIQTKTKGAVRSMEQVSKEVEVGKAAVDRSGNSLDHIIANSEKVIDMVTQVATACEEQSLTSEDISKNIQAIADVAARHCKNTNEIVSLIDSMNGLTRKLQAMIMQFRTGKHAGPASGEEVCVIAEAEPAGRPDMLAAAAEFS